MGPRLWAIVAIVAIPLILRLFKARPLPSRETIVSPVTERVLILGSSSGMGRDLAHVYARRGAKICLFARRAESLERVMRECAELAGGNGVQVLVVAGDIASPTDLIAVRDKVVQAWGGLDTLHIVAGVPSTTTLHDLAGLPLVSRGHSSTRTPNPLASRVFHSSDGDVSHLPTLESLENVAENARTCSEINFVGTTLSLATLVPLLATTSKSPVLHHLSSVAATIPAPRRTIYSATKGAAFMAVESCRVECEGSGVRFFSMLPGTVENDFRRKTATSQSGGKDELDEGIRHAFEKLLLKPEAVVREIMRNLSLNPAPTPLIPYPPFSFFSSLSVPPPSHCHLPWQYRIARMLGETPLGWLWIEPAARKKYGIGQAPPS